MRLHLLPVSAPAAELRQRAWQRAADLSKEPHCPWALERFKISVALTEGGSRGLPDWRRRRMCLAAGLQATVAGLMALSLWVLHVARHQAGTRQASLKRGVPRVIALHAEDTTRTRHVLQALAASDRPIAGMVLLGRVRLSPQQVRAMWSETSCKAIPYDLPLVLPMSPGACLRALANLPREMARGILTAAAEPFLLPLREEVAIAFRVMLGLSATQWWRQNGMGQEVLFGHTGTADTTLFECAIQHGGARTIHLVHGQATGPNFCGFSDVALFRSRCDANAYRALGCYGKCDIQPTAKPDTQRGTSGLLLLSNLAHPMNAGFRKTGLRDELNLLNLVADVARSLGQVASPLLWKPHPVIATLPIEAQTELRITAKALGFIELGADEIIESVGASCRWVVSSPSTVGLDLLQEGVLCVVLDPQCTLLDTAIQCLSVAATDGAELEKILLSLNSSKEYSRRFIAAWNLIDPARPLDLNLSIK